MIPRVVLSSGSPNERSTSCTMGGANESFPGLRWELCGGCGSPVAHSSHLPARPMAHVPLLCGRHRDVGYRAAADVDDSVARACTRLFIGSISCAYSRSASFQPFRSQ